MGVGRTSEDKLGLAGVSTYLLQVENRILLLNAFQNQDRDGTLSVQIHAVLIVSGTLVLFQ